MPIGKNEFDPKYLRLQFKNRILTIDSNEYQRFFSDIMTYSNPQFQKMRNYGPYGDRGNDGYIQSEGIYYQVYAPLNNGEKDAAAVNKMVEDFEKLKTYWEHISMIRQFYFVYNTKTFGSTIPIEDGLSELRKNNPSIAFGLFLPSALEELFMKLKPDQIASLHFDMDSSNYRRLVLNQLIKIDTYIEIFNIDYAYQALSDLKEPIKESNDELLMLDYLIQEARICHYQENVQLYIEMLNDIYTKYPEDIRAICYLSEIYFITGDRIESEKLLKIAESKDLEYWHHKLLKIMIAYHDKVQIDVSHYDDYVDSLDLICKAKFYKWFSIISVEQHDIQKAMSYIERAISYKSETFDYYQAKLAILQYEICQQVNPVDQTLLRQFNDCFNQMECMFNRLFAEYPRLKASQLLYKILVYIHTEEYDKASLIVNDCFESLKHCYFDFEVQNAFSELFKVFTPPENEFQILIDKIQAIKSPTLLKLAKRFFLIFLYYERLNDNTIVFFESIKCDEMKSLSVSYLANDSNEVLRQIGTDSPFLISLFNVSRLYPDIRKAIIDNPSNDPRIQKDRLMLLFNYDEGNIDDAFRVLKEIDLSNITYSDCLHFKKIAYSKKAWDLLIEILRQLINHTREKKEKTKYRFELFNAYLQSDAYIDVIDIGEQLLNNSIKMDLGVDFDYEYVLAHTLTSLLMIDEPKKALLILNEYVRTKMSFTFTIGHAVEVYIHNDLLNNALNTIIHAMTELEQPSEEQFARLFIYMTRISGKLSISLESLPKVVDNCFVKVSNIETWFYLGDTANLDATKVLQSNSLYKAFIDKQIGDSAFSNSYQTGSSNNVVEKILLLKEYVVHQCYYFFNKLSFEHRLDGVQIIDLPTKDGSIEIDQLKRFMSDSSKQSREFLDLYCSMPVPIALYASVEGSLPGAISAIVNEERGFLHITSGQSSEFDDQKLVAERLLTGEAFYLDGSCAFFMTELGIVEELLSHLQGMKIPQSVITSLVKISERFRFSPDVTATMGFHQDKIMTHSLDKETFNKLRREFKASIDSLSSNRDKIVFLSDVMKESDKIEFKILPELCDACVLSQRESIPILTDDYLYLQYNEIATGKTKPEYCSLYAVICVLYDKGLIDFSTYLKVVSYYAFYRSRFINIDFELMSKCVFGDANILEFKPDRLKALNLPITLSRDYGVGIYIAFGVVSNFLTDIVLNDSIVTEFILNLFDTIVTSFPNDVGRKVLETALVSRIKSNLESIKPIIPSKTTTSKIELLNKRYLTNIDIIHNELSRN